MSLAPNTPVLVGYGQVNQHEAERATDPVGLMAAAARHAAPDRVLASVDAIRVVNLLSWRYRDPGLLLGQLIGAGADGSGAPATWYSGIGGNVPQSVGSSTEFM